MGDDLGKCLRIRRKKLMIKKYVKKPIEVTAVRFTDELKNMIYHWANSIQANIHPSFDDNDNPCLIVPTLEGEMKCSLGDWLIVEPFSTDWRKIYPCKSKIFEKTYEEIESLIEDKG